MIQEVYLDVRKLNGDDLAAILVEERMAGNEKRIKPYRTWIGLNGEMPFPVGVETELKRTEVEGVAAVQRLARSGFKTVIWISPPGGMSQYEESRMIIYLVDSVEETRVNFKCVAICSQHTSGQCLEIAKRILRDGGICETDPEAPDDLRSEPIGLAQGLGDWAIDYLEKAVSGIPEVWAGIRAGVHEENDRTAQVMADIVVREFRDRAAAVRDRYQALMLGAEIERMIQSRFNLALMRGGVHGMSNVAALQSIRIGAFDSLYTMAAPISNESLDARLKRCNKCGSYFMKKKENCPNCTH